MTFIEEYFRNEGLEQGLEQGRREGRKEAVIETAQRMRGLGLPEQIIQQVTVIA